MKKITLLFLILIANMTYSQQKNCLDNYTKTSFKLLLIIEINQNDKDNFVAEITNYDWKYLPINKVIQFYTLPNQNNYIEFHFSFPNYAGDKYSYFIENSQMNLLPEELTKNLNNLSIERSTNINPIDFIEILKIVKGDIEKNINIDKFDYFFADKREEIFSDKEYASSASIYNDEKQIIGRIHKFSGNMTITGHNDCSKIDFARITLYNAEKNNEYFINLKDLENNSIIPIKEGTVFLEKYPVDLKRLEYCKLFEIISNYAQKNNNKLSLGLI